MAIARGTFSFNIARTTLNKKSCSFGYSHHLDFLFNKPIGNKNENLQTSIELLESDFEEKFIKGSGPGGQKTNKTSNCVELKHKKTGIVVKCHESRSLQQNRQIARARLLDKLKYLYAPSESSVVIKKEEKLKKEKEKLRKRKMKEEAIANKMDF